ncbi:hypothetical protein [Sporocytophaga myxococcoides]|uniref:hypothetical protein n=1 Tax=Sporocytophaga myxococcoides TaxID=153721 RepID=UPI000413004A|nr:hypothetical protein [Sporocytophaga myxococcoides]
MAISLRKIFRAEIKQKCPELLRREKSLLDYVADKYIALFIVVPIYIILYLSTILIPSPECLKVITLNNAKDLNNSSNGILASIVGITMVIIGFIFTEIKSKTFVSFKFFSEKTFLFPIFYSSLVNIVGMLIISLLADTITKDNSINNAVLLSNYLIILVNIPLIIVIFIRVAKYMDYKPVFNTYKEMVLKKATCILFKEKIVELFSNRLTKVLKDNNIKTTYTISEIHNPQRVILSSRNNSGVLYDVYIDKFEEAITSIKKSHPDNDFQYSQFLIGKNIGADTPILYANEDYAITPKVIKLFKVKESQREDEIEYTEYMKDIHQQYIDAVRNNNGNLAVDYLSIYKELNELYCNSNKSLR